MYYFAYGSNLSHKQMLERCPDSKPRFRASLPNYNLIFAGYSCRWCGGVASIKPFTGEKVVGGIYEISKRDLCLLDCYEDYPDTYDRVSKTVITEDGGRVEAITYIKREQSEETQPSAEYISVIQQGYRDWRIV